MGEQQRWDIEGVVEALGSKPSGSYDTLLGSGTSLVFEQVPSLLKPTLELYPDRLCARYRSYLLNLDISNVSQVGVDEGRVRVEAEAGKLKAVGFFDANGSIVFNAGVNDNEEKSEIVVSSIPESVEEPEPEAKHEPEKASKSKEQPSKEEEKAKTRVTLTGRVGRDPQVTETKNGRKMLRVSLAVHGGGGETTWSNVMFFDAKAEEAAAKLAKGAMVTIVGYKHEMERMIKTPKGPAKKLVEVIYGAAIQQPKSKPK